MSVPLGDDGGGYVVVVLDRAAGSERCCNCEAFLVSSLSLLEEVPNFE